MIDYTKVTIVGKNFANNLLKNKELDWRTEVQDDTGEIIKHTSRYKDCFNFYVYPSGYSIIRGSLHKLKEEGYHNYSQFSFSEASSTIENLMTKFNILPEDANLTQFEFGVNVLMPYQPKHFLKRIIAYKNQLPSIDRNNLKKYVVRFENTEFEIKIYCKTSQYLLSENILRFEVKSKAKRFLHDKFLKLTDLALIDNYKFLEEVLLHSFEELLIIEDFNKKLLTKRENKIYETVSNPILWDSLKCRTQRYRYKKKYQILCNKYIKDSKKEFVRNQIKLTWQDLLAR